MARKSVARSSLALPAKRSSNAAFIKDPVEKSFMLSLQNAEEYVRLQKDMRALIAGGGTGGSGDLKGEEFEDLLQPFCRACWEECERTFSKSGDAGFYAAARAETELLKKKLNDCNLSCMKQVQSATGGGHSEEELGADAVTFFEPLQHLDPDVRELVLHIVAEKIDQIANGTAPNALMKEICDAVSQGPRKRRLSNASAGGGGGGGGAVPVFLDDSASELMEENEELKDRLEELEQKVVRTEEEKKAAVKSAKEQVMALDERLAQAQKESMRLQEEAERLRQEAAQRASEVEEAKEGLNQASAKLESMEAQLADAGRIQTELRETQAAAIAKAAELEKELQKEREATASVQAELERGRESVKRAAALEAELKEARAGAAQAKKQMAELEVARKEMQRKSLEMEQEASDLRDELEKLRKNPSKAKNCASQSTLVGSEIEHLEAENKRLKVALEELRAKLSDMVTECKKNGVSKEVMDAVVDKCGLEPLRKARSVFENLYQDAMRRVERLEKLRDKYRQEHEKRLGLGRPANAETAQLMSCSVGNVGPRDPDQQELGVLEAVQQSSLTEELDFIAPLPGRPGERLGYVPGGPLATRRDFKPQFGLVEPPVAPFPDRGLSTAQRAHSMRKEALEKRDTWREGGDASSSAVAKCEPAQTDSSQLPAGTGVPSSPHDGQAVAFAPPPRDVGAEVGGELARRLAASSSLPDLVATSRSPKNRSGREGGAGGAFQPHRREHPSLTNLIGGRQRGVDDSMICRGLA